MKLPVDHLFSTSLNKTELQCKTISSLVDFPGFFKRNYQLLWLNHELAQQQGVLK